MALKAGALEVLHLVDLAILQALGEDIAQRVAIDRQPTMRVPVVAEGTGEAMPGLIEALARRCVVVVLRRLQCAARIRPDAGAFFGLGFSKHR